jgi:hypothetical protein
MSAQGRQAPVGHAMEPAAGHADGERLVVAALGLLLVESSARCGPLQQRLRSPHL